TRTNTSALRNSVASMAPGTSVNVKAVRDGREASFQVALAELPAQERPDANDSDTSGSSPTGKFGMSLQPLTPETASRMGLAANEQGLVVTRVDPEGSAADAGIRPGDLIKEVNRRTVGHLKQ